MRSAFLGANRQRVNKMLRWATLLLGLAVGLPALLHAWPHLPWGDVLFFSVLTSLLSLRSVVMRRDREGQPTFYHTQGELLILMAFLRDGPDTMLAVFVFSNLLSLHLHIRGYRRCWVNTASNLCFYPALFWLGGCLYAAVGGHLLRTPADCAAFFQQPTAFLLPLLLMLAAVHEVVNRPYLALLQFLTQRESLHKTLRDPLLSLFDHMEALSGCLILLLWTAWGWGTLPFTLIINESLLLASRSYFHHLDARRDADCDPLTGLASWRGLETFLRRAIAASQSRQGHFALLFLDADGLKSVNDRLGHTAGDELIKLIGECCRHHARKCDLVARRGGDEFLLVLDGLDRADAERVKARVQAAIELTLAAHPDLHRASGVSAGLALYPEDAQTEEGLVEIADRQMYADKQARKGVVAISARNHISLKLYVMVFNAAGVPRFAFRAIK